MILQVVELRLSDGDGLRLSEAPRVVYDVDANRAEYSPGPAAVTGPLHALIFELVAVPSKHALLSAEITAANGDQLLLRCDRVDFPPGGVAHLHTHRGPGIRVLLLGSIRIETEGHEQSYTPLAAWFEPGPEPVFAAAAESGPTAFVRCMVLPPGLKGQSSIRYVRDEDAEKPKPQRYRVFVDELVRRP